MMPLMGGMTPPQDHTQRDSRLRNGMRRVENRSKSKGGDGREVHGGHLTGDVACPSFQASSVSSLNSCITATARCWSSGTL